MLHSIPLDFLRLSPVVILKRITINCVCCSVVVVVYCCWSTKLTFEKNCDKYKRRRVSPPPPPPPPFLSGIAKAPFRNASTFKAEKNLPTYFAAAGADTIVPIVRECNESDDWEGSLISVASLPRGKRRRGDQKKRASSPKRESAGGAYNLFIYRCVFSYRGFFLSCWICCCCCTTPAVSSYVFNQPNYFALKVTFFAPTDDI